MYSQNNNIQSQREIMAEIARRMNGMGQVNQGESRPVFSRGDVVARGGGGANALAAQQFMRSVPEGDTGVYHDRMMPKAQFRPTPQDFSMALTNIQDVRESHHGEIAQRPHPRTPQTHRPPPISGALTNYQEENVERRQMVEARFAPMEREMNRDIEEEYTRFQEFVRRRREQQQNEIDAMKRNDLQLPYKLFQLSRDFTEDQLKKSYKKLALATHPDKRTGSEEKFQLVTKCYMALLEDLKNRVSQRRVTAETLGEEAERRRIEMEDTGNMIPATHVEKLQVGQGQSFNRDLFNKIFLDNKIPLEADEGLGNWLEGEVKRGEHKKAAKPLFSKQFNMDVFNKTFEETTNAPEERSLIQQSHPLGLTQAGGENNRLDDARPDTFTIMGNNGEIAAADLRETYSGARLVDPRWNDGRGNMSAEEMKANRAVDNFAETREEQQRRLQQERLEQMRERQIADGIRRREREIETQFNRIHGMITNK